MIPENEEEEKEEILLLAPTNEPKASSSTAKKQQDGNTVTKIHGRGIQKGRMGTLGKPCFLK